MEVWRGTDGSGEKLSGKLDDWQGSADGEAQERKLDCVVRIRFPVS